MTQGHLRRRCTYEKLTSQWLQHISYSELISTTLFIVIHLFNSGVLLMMCACLFLCTQSVFVGLVFGTLIFMADLYFLVRTDLVTPKRFRTKPKTEQKKKKD